MANITDYLNGIKSAVYGKDVRSSIHDGIKSINNEVEVTTNKQKLLDQKFTEQIKNMTNNNPSIAEVVDARIGLDAKVYDTLGQRLDDHERNLKYLKKQQTLISKFHNKLMKNESVSIGLYGDSMTYGYDIVSADRRENSVSDNAGNSYDKTIASVTYPEAFQNIMNEVYGEGKVNVVVRAIGGDYVKKALERWLPKTYPIGTDVCVMNYGINDSRLTTCPYVGDTEKFMMYYRELIESELDNGTAVILMTPFKVRTTDVRIQTFETAVINLAKEYGIPVIVGDEMAANMSYKHYSDATHWNGEGYKYVGTRIASCFIGDGLLNPTRVSENTQLLTRRQLDGIWWDSNNKEIYYSSPSSYPTPDEAEDQGGLAIRIGANNTVYYSFYAEKDLWIAPFIGFNEEDSCAELKLNFGLESPDFTFDNFPMLGGEVDFTKRAVTTIEYTKNMPKASTRIHLGSILVDELPCIRMVTKGWHTLSITAKNNSIGLGGLVFVDTSYFETIRNRYTKFRNNIVVEPTDLSHYKDLTIYRNTSTGVKRAVHFGPNLRSNNVSASLWIEDVETNEVLNMLSLTEKTLQPETTVRIYPKNLTDGTAFSSVRQKEGTDEIYYQNQGIFKHDSEMCVGIALYNYTTGDELARFMVGQKAVSACKMSGKETPQPGQIDLGTSYYKFKDIHSTNGVIQTSDVNAKKEIEDIDLGLDFINQLRPVNFKFKENQSNRTHTGLIAQEVEKVLGKNDKALLIKSINVDEETGEENTSYSLRYSELIAPLIKSIQELNAKVEELQNKVK